MATFWEEMGIAPCLYRNCKQCGYGCYIYHSLHSLYREAMIPKKYIKDNQLEPETESEKLVFDFLKEFEDNIRYHVTNGHGVFLVSDTKGNGKTSWALQLLKTYLQEIVQDYDLGTCAGIYVNVPTFMKRQKEAIDEPDEELKIIKQRISTTPLVVWDDIGREKASDYSREILYASINERYENNLSQLFTSNKKFDVLKKPNVLGEDVVDRITEQCIPITFDGRGRREETAWWNIK